MFISGNHTIRLITLCTILFFTAPVLTSTASEPPQSEVHYDVSGVPLTGEEVARLQPGLLPLYFYNFFARNVRMLPKGEKAERKGEAGEPILEINHQFGRGEVFDSGTSRGVGVRMNGALNFPTPGTYVLQTLSNDGVDIYLNNKRVLADPTQHSDQFSAQSYLNVAVAGWYPIQIDYFQRKGTAALKLYWKTPGSKEKVIVPAEAYGHLPATK